MGNAELNLLIKAKDMASSVLEGVKKAAVGMVVAIGAGLAFSVKAASDAQQATAQLRAVLDSTKGAAGVTEKAALDLADSLSKVTKFSDETVLSAENMLLTFTSIGKEVFPLATETVLNMSQALGQDTKNSAIQLGKALNDPITGLTALRRVGVQFTDAQEVVIKKMVQTGNLIGAQKLILAELTTEFGNSARAAGETFAGKLEILQTKLGNVAEKIGGVLLPMLSGLIDNVVTPAVDALEPLVVILGEMFNVITGRAPDAGAQLTKALGPETAKSIMGALAMVRDTARLIFSGDFPALINRVIAFVGEAVPKINAQLLQWGEEFIKWVGPQIPKLIGELFKLLGEALTWVSEHKAEIKTELVKWGKLFGEFVNEVAIPALAAAVPGIVELLIAFATTVPGLIMDSFAAIGHGIVTSIGAGIRAKWDEIRNALASMLTQAIQAIDFWVGPFHISGISGITVSMPTITLPTLNLPSFAGGGIVPGAIGAPMLATVHGGEQIYDPRSGGGSGGITVNLTVQGSLLSQADLEERVRQAVRDGVRGGGFRGVLT